MKYVSVILFFCGLTVVGQVSADECDDLSFGKLLDCIVVEGAGDDYTAKPSTDEAYYDTYSPQEEVSSVMTPQQNNQGGETIKTSLSSSNVNE